MTFFREDSLISILLKISSDILEIMNILLFTMTLKIIKCRNENNY